MGPGIQSTVSALESSSKAKMDGRPAMTPQLALLPTAVISAEDSEFRFQSKSLGFLPRAQCVVSLIEIYM